ncbi:hypothetical protein AAAB33_13675 [Lentilactobacillus buchneri]|uniref:hypothetical protein n=1 Tax=Lentilactobacillus buchneri TaxID=1581 RepID=UPI0030F1363F
MPNGGIFFYTWLPADTFKNICRKSTFFEKLVILLIIKTRPSWIEQNVMAIFFLIV